MNRRKYLASAVAVPATAGCLGPVASGSSSAHTKMVSVVNAHGTIEGSTVGAKLVDDELTPDSTARLSLTYTNESDRAIELHIHPEHPAPLHSKPADKMPGLLLLPYAFTPARTSPNCWKPQDPPAIRPVLTEHTLDPGRSVTMKYEVWASPKQASDCIQANKYQFEPPKATVSLRVTQ